MSRPPSSSRIASLPRVARMAPWQLPQRRHAAMAVCPPVSGLGGSSSYTPLLNSPPHPLLLLHALPSLPLPFLPRCIPFRRARSGHGGRACCPRAARHRHQRLPPARPQAPSAAAPAQRGTGDTLGGDLREAERGGGDGEEGGMMMAQVAACDAQPHVHGACASASHSSCCPLPSPPLPSPPLPSPPLSSPPLASPQLPIACTKSVPRALLCTVRAAPCASHACRVPAGRLVEHPSQAPLLVRLLRCSAAPCRAPHCTSPAGSLGALWTGPRAAALMSWPSMLAAAPLLHAALPSPFHHPHSPRSLMPTLSTVSPPISSSNLASSALLFAFPSLSTSPPLQSEPPHPFPTSHTPSHCHPRLLPIAPFHAPAPAGGRRAMPLHPLHGVRVAAVLVGSMDCGVTKGAACTVTSSTRGRRPGTCKACTATFCLVLPAG
ncbi:unnamed protein product [Closterium sp. NIES-54]